MRRSWNTAFGNAKLDGRDTIELRDLPQAHHAGKRGPLGFVATERQAAARWPAQGEFLREFAPEAYWAAPCGPATGPRCEHLIGRPLL